MRHPKAVHCTDTPHILLYFLGSWIGYEYTRHILYRYDYVHFTMKHERYIEGYCSIYVKHQDMSVCTFTWLLYYFYPPIILNFFFLILFKIEFLVLRVVEKKNCISIPGIGIIYIYLQYPKQSMNSFTILWVPVVCTARRRRRKKKFEIPSLPLGTYTYRSFTIIICACYSVPPLLFYYLF